jgi:hypothetical protein
MTKAIGMYVSMREEAKVDTYLCYILFTYLGFYLGKHGYMSFLGEKPCGF